MTIEPRGAKQLTKTQREVWQIVFDEFMNHPPQPSQFNHVVAGDIADRVIVVLSGKKAAR